MPALSRLCHFRHVDVRLPHRHAVRPAVHFGSTETEEHDFEQTELKAGTGRAQASHGSLNRNRSCT